MSINERFFRGGCRSILLPAGLVLGLSLTAALTAPADTIHVPGDQPSIQAGIDASADGDTVLVSAGDYVESINFLGKAVHLRSEDGPWNTRIENGPGVGSVVTFESGEGPDSILEGFTIHRGRGTDLPSWDLRCGGGILCLDSSPTITGNLIRDNGGQAGSGIFCENSSAMITGNIIRSNDSDGIYDWVHAYGGGVCLFNCGTDEQPLYLVNNLIIWNLAIGFGAVYDSIGYGGGVYAGGGYLLVDQCTIAYNEADCDGGGDTYGGGVLNFNQDTIISNTIFHFNRSTLGDEIAVFYGTFGIDYSMVDNGWQWIYNESSDIEIGEGMLDVDPLFVGQSLLSQQAAGQFVDSLCVDAGNPELPPHGGTTRTDTGVDTGRLDMGFHYPVDWPPPVWLLAGAGPSEDNPPVVKVFPLTEDPEPSMAFPAYGAPRHGVNVTAGYLTTSNPYMEIITGPGPGEIYGPHVRGFSRFGEPVTGLSFMAYGTNRYGVNVTTGIMERDGGEVIITGAGPGAVFGPHVRGFTVDDQSGEASPMPDINFFAYGTPRWGVNVACGNIDGDWPDEIITGAGPGAIYGPHVRGWSVDDHPARAIDGVNFLAYGTNRMGVRVTCGDVDGDNIDEIITAPGPSPVFSAHIRGWNYDGQTITPLTGIDFLAWPAGDARYGASVFACRDLNFDGTDDLVVGEGPDPEGGSRINIYRCRNGTLSLWHSLQAFPDGWTHGVNVAAGRFAW